MMVEIKALLGVGEGSKKKWEEIPFVGGNMINTVAALSEFRFSLENRSLFGKIRQGSDITLTHKFTHPKADILNSELEYVLEDLKGLDGYFEADYSRSDVKEIKFNKEDIDHIEKEIKKEIDKWTDDERTIFKGELFSITETNEGGFRSLKCAAVCDSTYYRKIKANIFLAKDEKALPVTYAEIPFFGYPVILTDFLLRMKVFNQDATDNPIGEDKHDNEIIVAIKEMFSNFKTLYDTGKYSAAGEYMNFQAGDMEVKNGEIMQKFVENKLYNVNHIRTNFSGNMFRMFVKDNIFNILQNNGSKYPDLLSFWKVVLDVFGYEVLFMPYAYNGLEYPDSWAGNWNTNIGNILDDPGVGTKIDKRKLLDSSPMIVKPIYDEMSVNYCNIINDREVESYSYYKNFYREPTRVMVSFYLDKKNVSTPMFIKTCILDEVPTEDGSTKIEISKFVNAFYKLEKNLEKADKEGPTINYDMTNLEREKGIIPLTRDFNIYDVYKYLSTDDGTVNRDDNGDEIIEDEEGTEKRLKIKDKDGRWDDNFSRGSDYLLLQTVYDSIYGERTFDMNGFFNPFLMVGMPMIYYGKETLENGEETKKVFYGKCLSANHTISTTQLSTGAQMNRVVKDGEEMMSNYNTMIREWEETKNAGETNKKFKFEKNKINNPVTGPPSLVVFDSDNPQKFFKGKRLGLNKIDVINGTFIKDKIYNKDLEVKLAEKDAMNGYSNDYLMEDFYFAKSMYLPKWRDGAWMDFDKEKISKLTGGK